LQRNPQDSYSAHARRGSGGSDDALARLGVFDIGGRRVAGLVDADFPGGARSARWTGTDARGRHVTAVLYWVRPRTAEETRSLKLMVLR
jgi:hypothetical protein